MQPCRDPRGHSCAKAPVAGCSLVWWRRPPWLGALSRDLALGWGAVTAGGMGTGDIFISRWVPVSRLQSSHQ